MSALLHVEGLGLTTAAGPVFSDLTFTLEPATLSVVLGPSGSGRSAVLLAVCGRLKGVTGSVRLGGRAARTRSGDLRRRTAVARVATLVGPEDSLTMAESVIERALIDGVHPARAEAVFAAAEETLAVTFPRSVLVAELGAYEQALLCVALAGMRPADLVVLDDADHGLDVASQTRMFEALQRLCVTGWTVLVASTEPAAVPAGATVVALEPRLPRTGAATADESSPGAGPEATLADEPAGVPATADVSAPAPTRVTTPAPDDEETF